MTPFDDAVQALHKANIRHEIAAFPIRHISGGQFRTNNEVPFALHQYGVSYLSYHTNGDTKEYLSMYNDEEWDRFAQKANDDWSRSRKKGHLIFAIYNGMLVGCMASYIAVSNNEILKKVEDLGLSRNVVWYTLSPTLFRLYLAPEAGGEQIATMVIKNGHSGHIAFSYMANFHAAEYDYEIPVIDHARHLGKIDAVLDNMNAVLDTVSDLKIELTLKKVPASQCEKAIDDFLTSSGRKLSEREIMTLNEVADKSPRNALEWSVFAANVGKKRGYKGAAKTLLDIALDSIFK